MVVLAARCRQHQEEVLMLGKWAMQNKTVVRVASSAGAMTALALVVAAPGKWA